MTDETLQDNPLFNTPVVCDSGMAGRITRDLPYGEQSRVLDVYHASGERPPVVILVTGYSDAGFVRLAGRPLKDIEQLRSWGRLLAAAGITAVTYRNQEPVADALQVVDYVQENSSTLGVHPGQLGILSLSGNVPNALHVLARRPLIRAAALCYGFMLDAPDNRDVSAAASGFHFVNPNGTELELGGELALLLVRAGRDGFAGLNSSLDRFVTAALSRNLDLTLLNYPQGEHAFDILDDSVRSRQLVEQVIGFFYQRLVAA